MAAALVEIDRESLWRKIESVVDALSPISYAASRLPGAINMPPQRVDELAERQIPERTTKVVVYCANPGCDSSVEVATRLIELGYRNVRRYAGGKRDWAEAATRGRPRLRPTTRP